MQKEGLHPLADISPADLKSLRFQVLNLKKQKTNKQKNQIIMLFLFSNYNSVFPEMFPVVSMERFGWVSLCWLESTLKIANTF